MHPDSRSITINRPQINVTCSSIVDVFDAVSLIDVETASAKNTPSYTERTLLTPIGSMSLIVLLHNREGPKDLLQDENTITFSPIPVVSTVSVTNDSAASVSPQAAPEG